MEFVLLIIAAYLIGSIPFGLIISKCFGSDIRKVGSGNIGATNLARTIGKKWGCLCFILDAVKGFVPTMIASKVLGSEINAVNIGIIIATGSAAICGHVFPLYLKFKGGKGVSTSFGVALGIWPYYTVCALVSLATWLVVTFTTRYVSLGSIVAAIVFPVTMSLAIIFINAWKLSQIWPLLLASFLISFVLIFLHRSNIQRLFQNRENKI